jgi:glycosyltransferase involved in cell wall biosynthesis
MAARVLAVAQARELGGAEYGLLRIARRLPDLGFEVELTVPGPGPLERRAREAGIATHELAVGALRAGAWPRAAAAWPRARALARRLAPDLVYLNGTVAQRLAPALRGPPIVPHLHDLLPRAPRPWRSRGFWRAVPVVLCDSQAVADVAASLGAPRERLRAVGCPVEAVEPAPRPAWADGRPVVGYVGRIEPRKGTLDLLRALPALAEHRPDVRVVLVGDDELAASADYRAEVLAAADALGPERVVLAGVVEDAARLMPWFDVLCVPSAAEPFGTVAAEALAAGTPAVVTDSGGMPEYVVTGRNGAVVPVGDVAALADALDAVLARSAELGENGRVDAERFAAERVARAVADAFGEALAAGAGSG